MDAYDSAPGSALAQRYFIQALALAQAGDDRLLSASILDAMSHQAVYTGRFSGPWNSSDMPTPSVVGAPLEPRGHVNPAALVDARLGSGMLRFSPGTL